jgi:hypothetical protein
MPTAFLVAGAAAATLLSARSALAQPSLPAAPQVQPTPAPARPFPPAVRAAGPQGSPPPAVAAPPSPGIFRPLPLNPTANIVANLQASGEFTRLLAALQAANLNRLLAEHANLTLFAPTDAAFAELPPGELDALMRSPAQLQALLTYHIVATTIRPADLLGHTAGQAPAADNKPLSIDGSGPAIRVNDAVVLQPGAPAINGMIYPVDKVLTPPTP